MDAKRATARVYDLVRACAEGTSTELLLARIVPVVHDIAGCSSTALVCRSASGCDPVAHSGAALTWDRDACAAAEGGAVPAQWRARGIVRVETHELAAHAGTLVLAWAREDPRQEEPEQQEPARDQSAPEGSAPEESARSERLATSLAILDLALARRSAEEELADLVTRVDCAQQLANMGDYDWHIASDTNRWSDQLFRIYGQEPQSFNPSYERFLEHVHPDDRDVITAIHQRALATGEPYEMVERIVRRDGRIRFLASNGQVICDSAGTPVRMRGTCIDITDRVETADRFRVLVESCPDGVLVLGPHGRVVQANGRASELLGGDPVGHAVDEISAEFTRGGNGVSGVGFDGRALQLDVNMATLEPDQQRGGDGLLAAFVHDAGPRLKNESVMTALLEAQFRRRQALEINDNIVQGLTAAVLCMQEGDVVAGVPYLERTLNAARRIMDDWLTPLDGHDIRPGDLARSRPSTLDRATNCEAAALAEDMTARPRILVVDDSSDIRLLIGRQLRSDGRYDVVGEAADGEEAVSATAALQPDVVLLDLSMPRMDGLQALPLVLGAAEGVSVVVMSGFAGAGMAERVLAAGAARYIEKGLRMDVLGVIDGVLHSGAGPGRPA